jgi:hypothetical protein
LHLRSVLDDECVLVIVHSWLHLRSVLDDTCVLVIVHSWFYIFVLCSMMHLSL